MSLEYTTLQNLLSVPLNSRPMPDPECYIYLHHVDQLIILPTFAEANNDSINVRFVLNTPMLRTAPIYSYADSGPRLLLVHFDLHRDLMEELNYSTVPNAKLIDGSIEEIENANTGKKLKYVDYIDRMAKYILAAALPTYSLESKMVNPPLISLKLGNDIFIKGVVQGGVGVSYGFPILANGKYAKINIDFTICEVAPYEARSVMAMGSYRGLDTSLSAKNLYMIGSSDGLPHL